MDFFYLSLLFAGYSVAYSWDSNGDYEKRQLVPLPRIGRSYTEGKRQGLIPSPRVGRSSPDNGIEIDCQFNPESCNELMEYRHLHEVHEAVPDSPLLLRLIPLAGRRKRSESVAEERNKDKNVDDYELTKTMRTNPWDLDVEPDFFQRHSRQLIPAPRVGRSTNAYYKTRNQLITGMSGADDDDMVIDPIDLQLRAAFIPRLGKRTSFKSSFDRLLDEDDQYKRASAFTPRIGRAAFTPRIGKKANFVPRIGRSAEKVANDLDSSHS